MEKGVLADFIIGRDAGSERLAMQRVVEAIGGLGLETSRLERLKTAVAEAAMRAIERGRASRSEVGIEVRVAVTDGELSVTITEPPGEVAPADSKGAPGGGGGAEPKRLREADAGLDLVARMVDELRTHPVPAGGQELELVVRLKP